MSNFSRVKNKKKRKTRITGLSTKQKKAVSQIIEKKFEQKLELKHRDTIWSLVDINITPTFTNLTPIGDGTNPVERIGNRVDLEYLSYKFIISLNSLETEFNYVRMLIFQWFPDNAQDAPNWNQMFDFFTGTLPTTQAELMSPYILTGSSAAGLKSFKSLVHQEFILDIDNPRQIVSGFINKGFRKNIIYNDTANSSCNNIYVMWASDSTVLGDNPHVDGFVRVRYTDA